MMTKSAIASAMEQGIARIALDQPDRRNVLSIEMVNELNDALDAAAKDEKIRVVLLSGNGPAFCAGMDLKSVPLDDPPTAAKFSEALGAAYRKLLTLPVPLIAAVDGPAMGGAVGLALAADVVFVGPKAKLAFPETRVGVVPALVSVIARRRVAPGKLMGLALTGIEVGPSDAVRLGYAEFESKTSALEDAEVFARKIMRENSAEAMSRTKAFLLRQFLNDLEPQLKRALAEFRSAVATEGCKKGLDAFRRKVPIDWSR